MALLFKSETDRASHWRDAFARLAPDLDFREWPEVGDPAEIEFALVWHPIKGDLKRYPNLKAIFSLGAGIEHIFSDPELPKHIPVVRMVDHGLTKGMTEYVLMHVLRDNVDDNVGICGGSISCGTCMVQLNPEWYAALPPATEDERELLAAFNAPLHARLGCQLILDDAADGMQATLVYEE